MLHLVVVSGLCNRLFAIISAIRYARQTQQELIIYWRAPVARHGIPYHSESDYTLQPEHLNCFFKRIPNITLKTWIPQLADHLKTQGVHMLYDGSKIIPEFMDHDPSGKVIFPDNFSQLINAPLKFARANNVIINMPTHPFGFTEDPMELYRKYPQDVGQAKIKSQYELELSKFARKLTPITSIENIIKYYLTRINPPDDKNNKKKLGIHIRRTDLRTSVTQEELDKVLDSYINKYQSSHRIYLCSDEYNLQHYYSQRYSNRDLVTYPDATKTHNNLTGAQKSLVDLYLLASCDHILGTKGSSFSYFSWMLASDQTTFEIHS